jgi:hypothetical protein
VRRGSSDTTASDAMNSKPKSPMARLSYRERLRAGVVRYGAEARADVLAFRKHHHWSGAAVDPDRLRWIYERDAGGAALLLHVDSDVITGQVGVLRTTLEVTGQTLDATFLGELLVGHEHRLRGVGAVLVEAALPAGATGLAFAATRDGAALLRRSGFVEVGHLTRFVRLLSPGALFDSSASASRTALTWLAGGALACVDVVARARRFNTDATFVEVDAFDDRVDRLTKAMSSDCAVMASRTAASLNARYAFGPVRRSYRRFYLLRSGELLGYTVLHIDRDTDAWAELVDFGCRAEHAFALLSHTTDLCARARLQGLSCHLAGGFAPKALRQLGFIARPTATSLLVRTGDVPSAQAAALAQKRGFHVTSFDGLLEVDLSAARAEPFVSPGAGADAPRLRLVHSRRSS